jgi:hypothetical protein
MAGLQHGQQAHSGSDTWKALRTGKWEPSMNSRHKRTRQKSRATRSDTKTHDAFQTHLGTTPRGHDCALASTDHICHWKNRASFLIPGTHSIPCYFIRCNGAIVIIALWQQCAVYGSPAQSRLGAQLLNLLTDGAIQYCHAQVHILGQVMPLV